MYSSCSPGCTNPTVDGNTANCNTGYIVYGCAQGYYQSTACTESSARVCTACPAGKIGPSGSADPTACYYDPSLTAQCAQGFPVATGLVGVGAVVGCALATIAWGLLPRFHRAGKVPRKASSNRVVPQRV